MSKKNRKEESYEEWLKEQEDKRKNIVPYKYFIQALEKSYSHKPHLADLPYDRRSNNIDELQERVREIDKRVKANERLRKRCYKLMLKGNKNRNVAITATARELSCFIWGMMTDHIA